MAILAAAALVVVAPFLTGRLVGGVDARWYADVGSDYARQLRVGHHFPFVGEGPLAWNGGVHPFRSAPVLLVLSALWDLATLGKLGPAAVVHLALATSAVAGTLGFYLAAVRLAPGRAWAALAFALLYLTAPAWIALAACGDAYMSFVAIGALPLVLYGNACSVLAGNRRGYVLLGAGLALVWMCHPPIALLSTLLTVLIQAGVLVARDEVPWRSLAAATAWFLVLAAYYFLSMSELPARGNAGARLFGGCQLAGAAVFAVGLGRFGFRRRTLGWGAVALLGGATLAATGEAWAIWTAATAALTGALFAAGRGTGSFDPDRNRFPLLALSGAIAAALAALCLQGDPSRFEGALGALARNSAQLRETLRPLSYPWAGQQPYQLGFGLTAVLLLLAAALFSRRPALDKAFWIGVVGLVCCFVRVPGLSDFLLGLLPPDFVATAGVPVPIRTMPVLAAFTAMGGVVWIARGPAPGTPSARLLALGLAAAVAWSGFQARVLIQHARQVTATAAATADAFRTENVGITRYAYDLVAMPPYGGDGIVDPYLESRLLDVRGSVVDGGPEGAARAMEATGAQRVRLVCRPIAGSQNWFEVVPPLTVGPGEFLLLRFDFDPHRNYAGWLALKSEHGRREYHLPESGLPGGFGLGAGRSAVISLWNSGTSPEHYALAMSREEGNDLVADGGWFGDVTISRRDLARLPVQVTSLTPYRATIVAPQAGVLETPRVFLPGYQAWVDGRAAAVARTAQGLAGVPVAAGRHEIQLRYVGTPRLWCGLAVSAAGWAALAALVLRPLRALLNHRLVRFGLVGGVVTVFFMGLNTVMTRVVGLGPQAGFCAAYPFALAVHFTLNKFWTFGRRGAVTRKQVLEYLAAAGVTFLIQYPSFVVLQRVAGLPNWAAAGGANVIQMGVSYLLLRARVFGKGGEETADITT